MLRSLSLQKKYLVSSNPSLIILIQPARQPVLPISIPKAKNSPQNAYPNALAIYLYTSIKSAFPLPPPLFPIKNSITSHPSSPDNNHNPLSHPPHPHPPAATRHTPAVHPPRTPAGQPRSPAHYPASPPRLSPVTLWSDFRFPVCGRRCGMQGGWGRCTDSRGLLTRTAAAGSRCCTGLKTVEAGWRCCTGCHHREGCGNTDSALPASAARGCLRGSYLERKQYSDTYPPSQVYHTDWASW